MSPQICIRGSAIQSTTYTTHFMAPFLSWLTVCISAVYFGSGGFDKPVPVSSPEN